MSTGTLVILGILVLYLGMALAKHGELKEDRRWNFGYALINVVVWVLLLWWAGNFG